MSFFNAIYTLGGCRRTQPIQESSKITIESASQDTCAKTSRWLKWLVSFPIQIAHAAYNTAYIALNKDINKTVSHQISDGNGVHYMPFLQGKSGHIITSPNIIGAITPKFRHDPKGPFERELEDPFISIFKDLYSEVQVDQDDLLISCSKEHVKGYRDPLLEFIGPKALPSLRPQLAQVAEEVLNSIGENESISAKALAETYTVTIFARLFFNLPGTLQDFQNIAKAFSAITEYQFLKKWGNSTEAQWKYPIAKGDALIMPPLFAKKMTFGGGVHFCPGQWLARAEIIIMVKALLSKFVITSFPRKKELSTVPGFGFPKVEPVSLSLQKRT